MIVLDLRPRTVRLMSHLWGRGAAVRGRCTDLPGSGHLAARLTAGLTDGFMARRVAGRHLVESGPMIISIGNLALGGTGKTPVVAALADDLAVAGWKGAVLTRGFGSSLAGPMTVAADNVLAGDEARMMAAALAARNWPVIQARRRAHGLDHLLEAYPATEIVIVEDGHQTARLGRHLDVVILDGWAVTTEGNHEVVRAVTGPVFPFGPWRESAAGADRAGIWLLETDEDLPGEGLHGQAVATFQRRLTLRDPLGTGRADPTAGQPAVLSGIARPEAFEKSLGKLLHRETVLSVRCGDHARYDSGVVAKIMNSVQRARADLVVTTAKDWVKLKPFWPEGFPVLVADLEINWGLGKTLPALVGERLDAFRGR